MKTGILLPGSSTHPLLPHDFMAGFKAALNVHEQDTAIQVHTAFIGFGVDENLIYQEAEKLFMEQQVDVLLVFADEPRVSTLYPLVNALRKHLIVVNHGAKFTGELPGDYVSFHTLNGVLSAYLTGLEAKKYGSGSILLSDYYDGAYSLSQALVDGFSFEEDALSATFILKHTRSEFDAQAMKNYILEQKHTKPVFTVLSGELVPLFLEQMKAFDKAGETILFSSSVFMEEVITLGQALPFQVQAYTNWHPAIETTENQKLLSAFTASTGRETNSIAALGWDTALILIQLNQMGKGSNHEFSSLEIEGAKGHIRFDTNRKQFLSDQYLGIASPDIAPEYSKPLPVEGLLSAWNTITNSHPNGTDVGWINTYLCS